MPVIDKITINIKQGIKLPNLCPIKPAINGPIIVKTPPDIKI